VTLASRSERNSEWRVIFLFVLSSGRIVLMSILYLAMLARVYLTLSPLAVPLKGLLSVTGIIENARKSSTVLRADSINYALCTIITGSFSHCSMYNSTP